MLSTVGIDAGIAASALSISAVGCGDSRSDLPVVSCHSDTRPVSAGCVSDSTLFAELRAHFRETREAMAALEARPNGFDCCQG